MDRCLAGFLAVSENLDRLAKAIIFMIFKTVTQSAKKSSNRSVFFNQQTL